MICMVVAGRRKGLFKNVIIQYLNNYNSQTHEKSASLMGLLTPESRSYAQNSKCFELY